MDDDKKLKERIASYLWLGLWPAGVVWASYVFTILWGWFILPIFPSAPTFSLGGAVGLLFVLSYLQGGPSSILKWEEDGYIVSVRHISHMITAPFTALIIGWILHQIIY